MAITSTYPIIVPKLTDLIVGTQTYTAEDPVLNNPTRNFTVQSIADLVSSPGTANTIAMFSTSGLTDSLITQAGSSITVAGDIKASGAIIDSGTTTLANLTLKSLNSGYGGGGIIDIMGGPQDFVRYETNVKLGGGTTVASQVYDMNGDGWTWDGNMQTGVNTGTSYNFKSGGSSQMVIFNNNVGIGITNPSAPLHVVGSTLINGSLYFGDNTTTDPSIFNYANSLHLYAAAGNQTGIANTMMGIAQAPVDLSGQRAAAVQQAQGALGTSQAAAGQRGGLGGSRQAINQAGIEQGLAANFAGIDQAAQQQQVGNLNAAMGMQGQGANTLGMIGQAQQAQNQAQGDADYTALAQRIGLFSGVAPKEQNTNSTGGK